MHGPLADDSWLVHSKDSLCDADCRRARPQRHLRTHDDGGGDQHIMKSKSLQQFNPA